MINNSRLTQLLQNLLAIDSQNPPGHEVAIADFIEKDMKAAGQLKVKIKTYEKNRPNVLVTLEGTKSRAVAKKQALLITPHIDTVPVGGGWTKDPFGTDIVGNKIYGRGASDDKGNLACCMEVLRSLVEDGVKLNYDLIMAATADEETGSHAGILPLLKDKTLTPHSALITDSEDYNTIVSQKGLMHLRCIVPGKKAHGAYNWLGDSAIEKACVIIQALKKHKFSYTKTKYHKPPSVNIGMIKGGDKVNMVADWCEFAIDVRFPPGRKCKDMFKEVIAVIRAIEPKANLEVDDMQEPYLIDPDHAFVKIFTQTSKQMGLPVKLAGSEGATVISFFQNYNIPAFSTGWGASGTMHSTNEYAELSTIHTGARLLEQFIKVYDAR